MAGEANVSGITELTVPNFAVPATLDLSEILEFDQLERGSARLRK